MLPVPWNDTSDGPIPFAPPMLAIDGSPVSTRR
jgi:hypothetical protein